MRKSLLITLLMFCATASFAQVKVRLGLEAGSSMSMLRYKNSASESNISPRARLTTPGVKAGFVADIALTKQFYLQPGVLYSWNNSKVEPDVFTNNGTQYQPFTSYSIHNVQIPVYALYKSSVEGTGRFIAGAGPYIGYAFSGRIKERSYTLQPLGTSLVVEAVQATNSLKIGNDKATDQYKPLDYGLVGTLGYESNVGLYFRGQFNYGLANLMPAGNSDHSMKSWGFGVSIGYFFGPDGW